MEHNPTFYYKTAHNTLWIPPLQGSDWMIISNLILKKEAIINYSSVWTIMEKELATHSTILAWKIPWMEEPSRLQSVGLQRVRHDWEISLCFFLFLWAIIDIDNAIINITRGKSLTWPINHTCFDPGNKYTFSLNVTQAQSNKLNFNQNNSLTLIRRKFPQIWYWFIWEAPGYIKFKAPLYLEQLIKTIANQTNNIRKLDWGLINNANI